MMIMKLIPKLFAIAVTLLVCGNAQASISMSEREHAQTIVWIVEAVTFVTAIGIALLVWRVSKKDRKTKKRSSTHI